MPVKLTAKHAGLAGSEVAALEQSQGLTFPESVTLRPSDVLSVKLKPGFAEIFEDYG